VNSTLRATVLLGVGFGVAVCAMVAMPARLRRRLGVVNHRGREVPATLGIAVFVAAVLAQLVAGLVALIGGTEIGSDTWALMAGTAVVFAVGLVDDLLPGGPRGLRAHGKALLRRRVTTGALKALAALGGAVLVVLTVQGRSPVAVGAGILLIAGSANLWNGLDVAPGRAGKAFVVGAVALMFLSPPALLVRLLGAEAAALWPDLRERAMLGDSGSNLLGFVLGAAMYTELSDLGVMIAAGAAIALNLLAETVTLSRAIEAVAPFRWLDGAGRPRRTAAPVPEVAVAPEPEGNAEPAGRR
jgi:UDP-GlcNAc:undecaprenyl-phosphate/decaprenyl-phosphate GlcNAc-1-phosphate transferase